MGFLESGPHLVDRGMLPSLLFRQYDPLITRSKSNLLPALNALRCRDWYPLRASPIPSRTAQPISYRGIGGRQHVIGKLPGTYPRINAKKRDRSARSKWGVRKSNFDARERERESIVGKRSSIQINLGSIERGVVALSIFIGMTFASSYPHYARKWSIWNMCLWNMERGGMWNR